MHGVWASLLEAQAASVALPLVKVPIPFPCSNEQYAERMKAAMERALGEGISAMVFGDLYLEDVRRYREENLHTPRHAGAISAVGHRNEAAGRAND
jgi:diphthamide synthase (EF-2-diphthine--ammonia ligase)